MSRKEQFFAAGLICASVGLFYLAIDFWLCGSGSGCMVPSQVAKALEIQVPTDTPDGWAGPGKQTYNISDPGQTFQFRSVDNDNGDDDGDDGDDDGGN